MTREEREYNIPFTAMVAPGSTPNFGLDSLFRQTLRVGTEAPDFRGRLLDGGEVVLSSFRGRSFVYLVFGPMTGPPVVVNVRAAKPSLVELYAEYHSKGFKFFWVYTRETHVGRFITTHASFEQKLAHARRFQEEDGVTFPIVVDSLAGEIHKRFGDPVNMSYLINLDGIIVYKSDWTDTAELPGAFDNLLRWEEAKKRGVAPKVLYVEKLHYMPRGNEIDPEAYQRVLERAGPEARADMKQAFGVDPHSWQREKQ